MRIVVASKNPVKIAATEKAFAAHFAGQQLELTAIEVDSGAGEQPRSDAATRDGARSRAINARSTIPDADYWVGMEGGIDTFDDQLMAFAWMAVQDRSGRFGEARSVTLPLPPAVRELIAAGLELGAANDRVFATVNSKQGGGAFGLLTEGRYTRESVYCQTLIIALVPLVNGIFSSPG